MWTYLFGPFLALLPVRWRAILFWNKPVNWVAATVVSGFVEALASLLTLALWYLSEIQRLVNQQTAIAADAVGKARDLKGLTNIEMAYSMGLGGLLTFALNPLTWLLAYCTFEGIWRALAATVNQDAHGTGLLAIFDWMYVRRQKQAYETRVPLVEDRVTRAPEGPNAPEWTLKVESCRPKPSWKGVQIIRVGEEYFRALRETHDEQAQWRTDGLPRRPHIYYLKRIPAGEAYLGHESYSPRDVLKPAGPGLGAIALGALKDGMKMQVTPLVADVVKREVKAEGVFLHIESCRPKEQWTTGRVLKFEDCYYRLERSYEREGARPWCYSLTLLPMGVAGRGVILYDPEELVKAVEREKALRE